MEEEKKLQEKDLENKNTEEIKEEEKIVENQEKKEIVVQEEPEQQEEQQENNDTIEEKTENNHKKINKKGIIIIVICLIVLMFLSTIFAIININNEKIIKGVCIQGMDVSNLTEEEAKNKLQQKAEEIYKKDITLEYKEYNETITPEQIEAEFNFDKAVKEAYSIGKTNNIIIDNFTILKANILKTNIDIQIKYNKEILSDMIKNMDKEIPGAVKEVSYEIDDDKLLITKGAAGVAINEEKLEKQIIENIKNKFNNKEEKEQIPVTKKEEEKINIEQIYKEIYKEPQDAYIEQEPFKLHVEENGLDFEITMDEAKELLKEEKETYEIPLKITKPKVKTENLGDKIFKQTLSKYTTIYDAGNTSRSTNIAIATRTINGTIILPGETFSYNKVLGNTTKEKGYQLGGAYVGGKVVQAYGGGICQVSTTLYNAVLYANLEIVERYNHSYAVSYVPAGRDATVSYGGKDFKFKNTRTYPVKIVASAKNGVVSISLTGIKEEKEYEIELKSKVLSTTPYQITYQNNSSLPEGKQKIIQKGYNGLKSKAYKTIKYNGKVISTTLLSADTYQPMNRIIEKGTKTTKKYNTETKNTEEPKEETNIIVSEP